MQEKLGKFLYPYKITIAVFLVLLAVMPVLYVYTEPERTNYVIGEKQVRVIKTVKYISFINEYVFHTEGGFDLFLGILLRDYYDNLIGIPLILSYYILAAGINKVVQTLTVSMAKEPSPNP